MDQESIKYAESIGLEAGTAKDVAKRLGLEIDKQELAIKLQNKPDSFKSEYEPYNNCGWTYELDEFLKPYESKAKDVGILMTPVLLINGKMIHQGSVPEMEKVEKWLSRLC